MTARAIFWVYVLLILYTLAPVLSVLISSGIAMALGAQLDEANNHPAYLLGVDIGGLLSVMFVLGWLALVTIPTGLIALVVFTIAWPASLVARKAMRNKDDDPVAPRQ
jgi:hypothetical protein